MPLCMCALQYKAMAIFYKYKNEVGYRDDTVPKTVNIRRHSLQQSFATPKISGLGCGRLLHTLTPPRSAFSYLQCLAQCHPYILLQIFILVSLMFYAGLAVTVKYSSVRRDDRIHHYTYVHTYTHAYCARELQQKL